MEYTTKLAILLATALLLCGSALAQQSTTPQGPGGPCSGDLGGTFPACTVTGGTHLTGSLASGLTYPSPTLSNTTTFSTGANVTALMENVAGYNLLTLNNVGAGGDMGLVGGATADTALYIDSNSATGKFNFRTNNNVSELDFNSTTAATWTSTTAWTLSNATIKLSGITTGTNADFVCLGAGGIMLIQASACTISSTRFKDLLGDYRGALRTVERLDPAIFTMKPGERPNPDRNYDAVQIGLKAENVAAVEPRCAIYEPDGVTPKSYRQECLIAVLVQGMKEQQREIADLKRRLK